MSVGLALGTIGSGSYGSIRTKADAMKFALEGTVEYGENGKVYNYDKAKELFEFFCKNVPIMETDVVPLESLLEEVFAKVKEYSAWLKEEKEKAG